MAYNAVPTKSPYDTWTHTDHNTYVRDNFAAGIPDVMTTKGDLVIATAANAADRLAAGTNGQVLTADSTQTTGIKWAAPTNGAQAYAFYTRTTNQTISTATYTIIDYATSVFDSDSAVTTGASWKFTVPASHGGYYLVIAMAYLSSSAAWETGETALLALYKNNALVHRLTQETVQASGTMAMSLSGATVLSLAATDYIDVRIYQDSDSDATLVGTAAIGYIAISKVF